MTMHLVSRILSCKFKTEIISNKISGNIHYGIISGNLLGISNGIPTKNIWKNKKTNTCFMTAEQIAINLAI